MSIRLRNSWSYQGDDWWHWVAFLDDGKSGDLKNVEYVQYILHDTFDEPVRRVDDPAGGFRLETSGWGEFTLKAFVHFKDKSKKRLTHEIQLKYSPKSGESK